MKYFLSLAIIIFIASQILYAATLDSSIGTLVGPVNAPLNVWTDTGASTTLTLPAGGANVLVYATFSTGTTLPQILIGNWRLSDGATTSLPIQRYLSKGGEDAGVGTTIHLFELTTSGVKTFKLQHMTLPNTGNKEAKTFDVSLAALSLETSDGYSLAKSQDTTAAYTFQNTSTTFTPVLKSTSDEVKASVTTTAAAGKIMAFCSFNSLGVSVAETGQWELQIQEAGLPATRTPMCLPISRNLSSAEDLGACSLIGLVKNCNGAPLKANQAYEILLMFKSVGGNAIETKNVTISVFATSYMDTETTPAPHAFSSRCVFITGATSTTTLEWQDTGLSYDQFLAESTKVLLCATYSCSFGSGTTARYGDFRLSDGTYNSQEVRRYFLSATSIGSASNVGLTPAGSGTKTFKMQYAPVTASTDIKVINPTLKSLVLASASAPPTQAKDIVFDTVGDNSVELSWESGDGLAKLVIARAVSVPSSGPVDTTTYTASSTFGSGSALGDGYVVYIGTDDSVTVIGLAANTTYYFEVYEYNFSGSYIDYNITTATDNPLDTVTTPEPGMIIGLILALITLRAKGLKFKV